MTRQPYLLKNMRRKTLNGTPVKLDSPTLALDVHGNEYGVSEKNLEPTLLDRDKFQPGALLAVDWEDGYCYPLLLKSIKGPNVSCLFVNGSDDTLDPYTFSTDYVLAIGTLPADGQGFAVKAQQLIDSWLELEVECEPLEDDGLAFEAWRKLVPEPSLSLDAELVGMQEDAENFEIILEVDGPEAEEGIEVNTGDLLAVELEDSVGVMLVKSADERGVWVVGPDRFGTIRELKLDGPCVLAKAELNHQSLVSFFSGVVDTVSEWIPLYGCYIPPMRQLAECWESLRSRQEVERVIAQVG